MSNKKIYWKGPEELAKDPNYMKTVANEFAEDLPMEEFLGDANAMANSSTSRRDFLKFTGFSLAAATLAACESPVVKTIPYVNKPEDVTPGVANWYASSYYDGQLFGSVLVKSREGRPIFIKGNKKFGLAGGALHPRITASVLPLYDAARLQGPTISGKDKSWKTVDAEIAAELGKIAASGGNIRILSQTITSPSTIEVINSFITKLSGGTVQLPVAMPKADTSAAAVAGELTISNAKIKHIQYDSVSYFAMREANRKSFGKAVLPDYNFAKAKAIVSINADFLGNWLMTNEYTVGYNVNRKAENDWMSKHFQFETTLSLTGSNADVRVPIKPSQEGLVAAALYQHVTGKSVANVPADILEKTKAAAAELTSKKGECLVVAGANDENVQTIVNALNFELGNYNSTINLNNPVNLNNGNDKEVEALLAEMEAGSVAALLIYGCNPSYSLPKESKFSENLKKVGLTVSFASYADETASKCKYVCPDHHYLEAWNDHNPKLNHYALQQPLIRPLYNTAAWQESLLAWSGLAPRVKDNKAYYDIITGLWQKFGFTAQTEFTEFSDYWNHELHNGSGEMPVVAASSPATNMGDVNGAGKAVEAIKGGAWEAIYYQKIGMGDGQQANNPWLQELPDPISRVTWDNYVTMAPADMEKMGLNMLIAQEYPASVVEVTIGKNKVKLPVYPSPGQARNTIGIALGYGRGEGNENIGKSAYQTGEYGDYIMVKDKKITIGRNIFHHTAFVNGFISYNAADVNIKSSGDTYPIATTQTSHTLMERDSILRETTWSIFKSGTKDDYNEEHKVSYYNKGEKSIKDIDLWTAHPIEHIGHRWVMTIDLNSCTGCGNCIIACHTENNVPVVGKDEVRRARDMHWLRIDRYYSSETTMDAAMEKGEGVISTYGKMEIPSENPQVLFQPMLCHHCNHAPCETVCPVLATTHSKEGLNQMAYNRCIGTRYCANNCPYKVRRFNWFNYQDYKKFKNSNPAADDSARWVLNPDVTVRSRGVMEKCSFCVQRIQGGKLDAKKAGRKLVDGDVNTACQEACPTNAIQFGDWNDTQSIVKKNTQTDRAYMALEEVGIEPNVYYMVKVRNTDETKSILKKKEHKNHEGHGKEGHKEEKHNA
jgi:MoCo/4Fe-4S cofactor protein with predicted Tat translocation signal